jgi:UDP-N-acetylmuramoyl-tripeptide--D-alanyl-D-alanine ligase
MSLMATLSSLQAMLSGSALINASELAAQKINISRVGTDSRQIDAGELFVALTGERFDAHDFLSDVAKAGAGAALISTQDKCPKELPATGCLSCRLACKASDSFGISNWQQWQDHR